MNIKLITLPIVVTIFGCQNMPMGEHQAIMSDHVDNDTHISQGVYQVEFARAQQFNRQSIALNQALIAYCQSEQELKTVAEQWQQTMQSWMALQGQERGPQAALEQSWNVQFWPDKKNTTGRKMKALLKKDELWTADYIAQQSVTVQGLGALEWLIYDQNSDLRNKASSCQLGVAISKNLSNNSQIIMQAWQVNPWLALGHQAWQAEYIALLSNQLDYSMKKLSRPMAKVGQARPYFSESWRSKTSMLNIKANVAALKQLYVANGDGLDHLLRQRGRDKLADRIVNQFNLTLETWPTGESLFELLQTKAGYQSVVAQYNKLEHLNYLIHEEVAIELGVIIGFNATDGD